MTTEKLTCLINESDCGRQVGNPVCPKCGMDERVVYPGQTDRETAQTAAIARYWRTHSQVLEKRFEGAIVRNEKEKSAAAQDLSRPETKRGVEPPFRFSGESISDDTAHQGVSSKKIYGAVGFLLISVASLLWWGNREESQSDKQRVSVTQSPASTKKADPNLESSPTVHFPSSKAKNLMSTPKGELAVIRDGLEVKLQLDGKQLPSVGPLGLVQIFAALIWQDKVVFVLSDNCGGTACPWNDYFLVYIGADGFERYVKNEKLSGNLKSESIKAVGNSVLLDFGYKDRKTLIAKVDSNGVDVSESAQSGASMSQEDCDYVYTDLIEECARQSPCEKFPMSGAGSRGYAHYKINHPGFNYVSFESACLVACERGVAPARSFIEDRVCNIR